MRVLTCEVCMHTLVMARTRGMRKWRLHPLHFCEVGEKCVDAVFI